VYVCGDLCEKGFSVTSAASVQEALKFISSEPFDVLLSDLHMPVAGDGLTVVSAMRHANPQAVTLLLSAFPQMEEATKAILLQADEILVKPMDTNTLIDVIMRRLESGPRSAHRVIESVATILERTAQDTILRWLERVPLNRNVMKVALSDAMMVEESRMLQVSIFETLQENLPNLDFSVLLQGVMAIADEIDSQLSQAVVCFDAAEAALPT
jgi:YesN/AraC family two-component response regulator